MTPRLTISDHGIEGNQQLSHARGQGQLLFLALAEKPLIEGADDVVMTRGDECGHIEGFAHLGTTAPDFPRAPECAAVTTEGGDADEDSHLAAVESAGFREFGEERDGGGGSDARNVSEQDGSGICGVTCSRPYKGCIMYESSLFCLRLFRAKLRERAQLLFGQGFVSEQHIINHSVEPSRGFRQFSAAEHQRLIVLP
jgi:hypothetical protein